jgi:hypothetical protein
MGTSAARRAPTTALWRLAKGAATRYLSPEAGGTVTAGEVAARYLAALGEGDQRVLAAFRLTRKVAQDLGGLAAQATSQGWEGTLEVWGLGELAGASPEVAAQAVSAALVGADAGLEAVVARAAVVAVWLQSGAVRGPVPAAGVNPGQLVSGFLAAALHLRMALDLGEPLEAAAGSCSRLQGGLEDLQGWIETATAATSPAAPPPAENWRGLAGWTWVTGVMDGLIKQLSAPRQRR